MSRNALRRLSATIITLRHTPAVALLNQVFRHIHTSHTMSFPETMQAIAISKTGGLEVLERQTVSFPKQEPNQIVVKVCRMSIVLWAPGMTGDCSSGELGRREYHRHLLQVRPYRAIHICSRC